MDERFSKAVQTIYQAASNPELWPDALQAVADCFDDAGTVLLYNRDDGGFNAITSPHIRDCVAEYNASGWSLRDTRAIRSRERGYFLNRDAITDRDVLTEDEIRQDPFYTEFLAGYGLKYFAAAMVSPDPQIEVGISVQRRANKAPYSEAELVVLQHIGIHVEQALRLSVRLMNGELFKDGLVAAFEKMNLGIFVLDTLARIIFSNSVAQSLIGDGLEIMDGRLLLTEMQNSGNTVPLKLIASDKELDSLLEHARPILIHRASSSRPLVIYIMPLEPKSESAFLVRARAIVLVVNMEPTAAPDPSVVRDILGITLGEARIAALVGTGSSPKLAASQLGISEETARTVLKRVYSKVGVARQSELTGLLARLHLSVPQ